MILLHVRAYFDDLSSYRYPGAVMRARDVMVRDVITIGPDEDVSRAAKMLVDHDISALPVVDKHRHAFACRARRTS